MCKVPGNECLLGMTYGSCIDLKQPARRWRRPAPSDRRRRLADRRVANNQTRIGRKFTPARIPVSGGEGLGGKTWQGSHGLRRGHCALRVSPGANCTGETRLKARASALAGAPAAWSPVEWPLEDWQQEASGRRSAGLPGTLPRGSCAGRAGFPAFRARTDPPAA